MAGAGHGIGASCPINAGQAINAGYGINTSCVVGRDPRIGAGHRAGAEEFSQASASCRAKGGPAADNLRRRPAVCAGHTADNLVHPAFPRDANSSRVGEPSVPVALNVRLREANEDAAVAGTTTTRACCGQPPLSCFSCLLLGHATFRKSSRMWSLLRASLPPPAGAEVSLAHCSAPTCPLPRRSSQTSGARRGIRPPTSQSCGVDARFGTPPASSAQTPWTCQGARARRNVLWALSHAAAWFPTSGQSMAANSSVGRGERATAARNANNHVFGSRRAPPPGRSPAALGHALASNLLGYGEGKQ